MREDSPGQELVDEFILKEIETVPHLEALLLIWRSRPRRWSLDEMGRALFLDAKATTPILDDLARRGLIVLAAAEAGRSWEYATEEDRDRLMLQVEVAYRNELIRISRMIHAKAPAAVREFARAFRFKKERD